jgi:hypothetical protein
MGGTGGRARVPATKRKKKCSRVYFSGVIGVGDLPNGMKEWE